MNSRAICKFQNKPACEKNIFNIFAQMEFTKKRPFFGRGSIPHARVRAYTHVTISRYLDIYIYIQFSWNKYNIIYTHAHGGMYPRAKIPLFLVNSNQLFSFTKNSAVDPVFAGIYQKRNWKFGTCKFNIFVKYNNLSHL